MFMQKDCLLVIYVTAITDSKMKNEWTKISIVMFSHCNKYLSLGLWFWIRNFSDFLNLLDVHWVGVPILLFRKQSLSFLTFIKEQIVLLIFLHVVWFLSFFSFFLYISNSLNLHSKRSLVVHVWHFLLISGECTKYIVKNSML